MALATPKILLIVEDDPGLRNQLRWCFEGYEVLTSEDRVSALAQVSKHQPPVVTLDLGLPPDPDGVSEGMETLQQILAIAPHTKVIVVTGNDDRQSALRAVGLGAHDFFNKPVNADLLGVLVNRAWHLHELETENRRLAQTAKSSPLDGVICSSPEMTAVCRQVEKIAPSNATVMILGESGTGKECCAQAIHAMSARANRTLTAINCAAIPETLLESELFGYEKGAFTGAVRQTRGKFELANGGTLFLDEIGDLSLPLQAKLLRFLETRTLERVGGRETIPVDVRILCATHQDLRAKIVAGTFREDLFYRISEIALRIPPLRDRAGDIPLLARAFLDTSMRDHNRKLKGFSPDALAAINAHAWPGNVRELKNRVNRAVIMAEGKQITAHDLELDAGSVLPQLRDVRDEAERGAVLRALAQTNHKISQAAELLGISRPTLYDLMKKFGINPE